jgi:DNA-binding PucR family transcriptional regulator
MVHRGVGLPTLLRCYHVGQAKLWSQWMDVAFADVHDPEELKALVTWSTDFISNYLDAVRERVVVAYEDERALWERGREAVREDTIRALLAQSPEDADEASRRLRHELRRHHVAAILVPGPSGQPDRHLAELEAAAAQIADALGASSPLLMRAADGAIWSWASSFEPPGDAALVAAAKVTLPAGCSGAIGACGHGAEGFRESHGQARQALRASGGALVAFAQVGLASALLADPDAARRFASAELAALGEDGEAAASLRATLETYLAEGASHKRAALRLGVHDKTVVHRVRRAEELLGRPLTGRRAAVEAALVVRRLLPSA